MVFKSPIQFLCYIHGDSEHRGKHRTITISLCLQVKIGPNFWQIKMPNFFIVNYIYFYIVFKTFHFFVTVNNVCINKLHCEFHLRIDKEENYKVFITKKKKKASYRMYYILTPFKNLPKMKCNTESKYPSDRQTAQTIEFHQNYRNPLQALLKTSLFLL